MKRHLVSHETSSSSLHDFFVYALAKLRAVGHKTKWGMYLSKGYKSSVDPPEDWRDELLDDRDSPEHGDVLGGPLGEVSQKGSPGASSDSASIKRKQRRWSEDPCLGMTTHPIVLDDDMEVLQELQYLSCSLLLYFAVTAKHVARWKDNEVRVGQVELCCSSCARARSPMGMDSVRFPFNKKQIYCCTTELR